MSDAAILEVTRRIRVPRSELSFSYARSSGPGGQNVNKVNTKAILKWPVRTTEHLPEPVRARFLERFANRVDKEGTLLITSQRYRDQARNVEDCLSKLCDMIREVATPPKPRKPTRPTRASKQRRLQSKRQLSEKKQQRKWKA